MQNIRHEPACPLCTRVSRLVHHHWREWPTFEVKSLSVCESCNSVLIPANFFPKDYYAIHKQELDHVLPNIATQRQFIITLLDHYKHTAEEHERIKAEHPYYRKRECPDCLTTTAERAGVRTLLHSGKTQIWQCSSCHQWFIDSYERDSSQWRLRHLSRAEYLSDHTELEINGLTPIEGQI